MFEAKEDGNPILNNKKKEEMRNKARQAVSFEKRLQVETVKNASESRVPNKPLSMTFVNENAKVSGFDRVLQSRSLSNNEWLFREEAVRLILSQEDRNVSQTGFENRQNKQNYSNRCYFYLFICKYRAIYLC